LRGALSTVLEVRVCASSSEQDVIDAQPALRRAHLR
jgi:hypothetical protein